MTTGTADNGWALSTSRFIAAPPAAVWEAMTTRMEEYFCPRPWRCEIVAQEWCSGGRSANVMHGPDGERNENEGCFWRWSRGYALSLPMRSRWDGCRAANRS